MKFKMKIWLIYLIMVCIMIPIGTYAQPSAYTIVTPGSITHSDYDRWYYEESSVRFSNDKVDIVSIGAVQASLDGIDFNLTVPFRVYLLDRCDVDNIWMALAFNDIDEILIDGDTTMCPEITQSITVHEVGHIVYNHNMSDNELYEYKKLRGIPDDWWDNSEYLHRPTEIFAEDYRVLFGNKVASYNMHGISFNVNSIKTPAEIPGLRNWIIKYCSD